MSEIRAWFRGVTFLLCFVTFAIIVLVVGNWIYQQEEARCQKFGSDWHMNNRGGNSAPQCVNSKGEGKWLG